MEKSNASGTDVRLETDCAKLAVVVDWCIEPVEHVADGDWKKLLWVAESTVTLKQSEVAADCVNCTVASDWKRLPVAEPATHGKIGTNRTWRIAMQTA